jgi:hypothetical protein
LAAAAALGVALACVSWPLTARAFFAPDDYRYFTLLRDVDAGSTGAWLRACIVENRWDDNWWIDDGAFVRFFRPFVAASLALDRSLWGLDPVAMTATNVVLHWVASLLVFDVLRSVLGSGGWALAGALLFAVQPSRAEHLFFVAGRTDTIAGLLFFACLAVFLRTRQRGGRGAWAVPAAFGLALLGKEHGVLLLPAFALADRWLAPAGAGRRWPVYAACAAVLVAYVALRAAAVGDSGAGPAPYFYLPHHPEFGGHAAILLLQYAAALGAGAQVVPFVASFDRLAAEAGALLWPGAAVMAGLLAFGAASPRGRFLSAYCVATLACMLPLYSTGRYLYLPALGSCGLVALLAARLEGWRRGLGVALAAAAIGWHGWRLAVELQRLPPRPPGLSTVDYTVRLFEGSRLDLQTPRPIYVVDFPMPWDAVQFLGPILATELGPNAPSGRVLCRSPNAAEQGFAAVRRVGPRSIEVSRAAGRLHEPHPRTDFAQREVRVGDVIRERDYEVEVLGVRGPHASRIRVTFDRSLDAVQLARCAWVEGDWRLVPIP